MKFCSLYRSTEAFVSIRTGALNDTVIELYSLPWGPIRHKKMVGRGYKDLGNSRTKITTKTEKNSEAQEKPSMLLQLFFAQVKIVISGGKYSRHFQFSFDRKRRLSLRKPSMISVTMIIRTKLKER